MPCCSALNCSNHSRKGFKFYRFPADPERRMIWLFNCGRQNWIPTQDDRLCSIHFAPSQIEQNRRDGKKRLLPFAVPTIFNGLDPPKLFIVPSKNVYDTSKAEGELDNLQNKRLKLDGPSSSNSTSLTPKIIGQSPNLVTENLPENNVKDAELKISELQKKVAKLEEQLKLQNEALSKFLTPAQIEHLQIERKFIKKWSQEDVLKSLKLRFALGKNGYNFLRETGYPAPSRSTINKRITSVNIEFGLLQSLVDLLAKKVEAMTYMEKDCSVMVDKMEISGNLDFDKSKEAYVGNVTLGVKDEIGTHLMIVALLGIKSPWKQILACHVTGPSTSETDIKLMVSEVIHTATSVGLRVVSICSDMDSNSQALWTSFGVCVSEDQHSTNFQLDDLNDEINILVDGPHLLQNWKFAIQNSQIYLPMEVVKEHDLPTNEITGKYITDLWNMEMKNGKHLRPLRHLTEEIITQDNLSKINVGHATRYISIKTAAALETAVIQKTLPAEALSTAWFLRMLRQWFELINSRRQITSITPKNIDEKEQFMDYFVSIIEQIVIDEGWNPLNTATILTSISFVNVAKVCFERGYTFLLGSRLTQDLRENIFSQIIKKVGMKPSAVDALNAVKGICLSQYMADTKNSNCCGNNDLDQQDDS